jgi:hypothetical protein
MAENEKGVRTAGRGRASSTTRSAHTPGAGRDIRRGDVLALATGDVLVRDVYATFGGVEAVVVPAKSKLRSSRVLWFWPSQWVAFVSQFPGARGEIGPRPVRTPPPRRSASPAPTDCAGEAA